MSASDTGDTRVLFCQARCEHDIAPIQSTHFVCNVIARAVHSIKIWMRGAGGE